VPGSDCLISLSSLSDRESSGSDSARCQSSATGRPGKIHGRRLKAAIPATAGQSKGSGCGVVADDGVRRLVCPREKPVTSDRGDQARRGREKPVTSDRGDQARRGREKPITSDRGDQVRRGRERPVTSDWGDGATRLRVSAVVYVRL